MSDSSRRRTERVRSHSSDARSSSPPNVAALTLQSGTSEPSTPEVPRRLPTADAAVPAAASIPRRLTSGPTAYALLADEANNAVKLPSPPPQRPDRAARQLQAQVMTAASSLDTRAALAATELHTASASAAPWPESTPDTTSAPVTSPLSLSSSSSTPLQTPLSSPQRHFQSAQPSPSLSLNSSSALHDPETSRLQQERELELVQISQDEEQEQERSCLSYLSPSELGNIPMRSTRSHTVLCEQLIPASGPSPDSPLRFLPFPNTQFSGRNDQWNDTYVRMPYSFESFHPHPTKPRTRVRRWDLINASLSRSITTAPALRLAILEYNSSHQSDWDFESLIHFLSFELSERERNQFFHSTLPAMQVLALRLPQLITQPIPLLLEGSSATHSQSVTLSLEQSACLLACAFFCLFPMRNRNLTIPGKPQLPSFNFQSLFMRSRDASELNRRSAKLRCLIHYFERVTLNNDSMPQAQITYERRHIRDSPPMDWAAWATSAEPLAQTHFRATGTIEDDGLGHVQVDFANSVIGGGVLNRGAVQEEIRFCINPDFITARLFTPRLTDLECLVITGAPRYSRYSGYASSFRWSGPFVNDPPLERDQLHRFQTQLVAIDALVYHSYQDQFADGCLSRELNKALCGFAVTHDSSSPNPHASAVATGNWGCGAFGGDKQLKLLLQLLACSVAHRGMLYFTFGDIELRDSATALCALLRDVHCETGVLVEHIRAYAEALRCDPTLAVSRNLFAFIEHRIRSRHSSALKNTRV